MKKFIFFLSIISLLFCSVSVDAKKKTNNALSLKDKKVEVFLKSGEKVTGTCLSELFQDRMENVKIKADGKGKVKYKSTEVDSIVFDKTQTINKARWVFEPKKVQLWAQFDKYFKTPVFLLRIYTGNMIVGYQSHFNEGSNAGGYSTAEKETFHYYYQMKGIGLPQCYWQKSDGNMLELVWLKNQFKHFPGVVKEINKARLTKSEIDDNPEMLLPLIDKGMQN